MTRTLRKLLLLLISLAVVVLAILSYQWLAGTDRTGDSEPEQGTPAAPVDWSGVKRIGSDDASLDSAEKLEYHRRGLGGRVERVYRAEVFDLEAEDRARLEDVTFIWHLKNGQAITLTSDTGRVHLDRGGHRMQPTSGRLTGNVRIVFQLPNDSVKAQNSAGELVITTDELEFDMRSCLLWTDRAVQLRGTDLDANGAGFQLRWREVSQEIDRLVIKEGGELTWRGARGGAFDKLIDDSDGAGNGTAGKAASKPSADPERIHSYLATFNDDVRIAYNDRNQVQTIRSIDCLKILFDLAFSQEPAEQAAVVESPSPDDEDTDVPTRELDDVYPESTLRLIWNGPLEVVPAELQSEQAAAGGRLRFEALGSPLEFNTRDVSGSCAQLQAQQDTGMVRLSSKEDVGVHLELSDGTEVATETLVIEPPAKNARQIRMLGKGNLETIDRADHQITSDLEESDNVKLSWQESALLKLVRLPQDKDGKSNQEDNFYLSEATANGQVVALSKKFITQGNMVYIELDPPGSDGTEKGQAIRVLRAEDQFSADLSTEKGKLTVEADAMETKFKLCSSGKGQYPASIDLTGNVVATEKTPEKQSESRLECRKMRIDLVEDEAVSATNVNSYGNADVSQIVAEHGVIGRYSVEGQLRSGLRADKLVADNSTHTTTLYGQPAELNRGQNDWLSSEVIVVTELGRNGDRQKDYTLTSPGPGEMRLTFTTADETKPPALLGLEWTESLTFNKDTLDGKPVDKAIFRSLEDKRITGAILHSPTSSSQFAARELELYLQNKEEGASPDRRIVAEDTASPDTFFKPMGDKALRRMAMKGQAQIGSIEHPAGNPKQRLRAAFLTSDVLNYDIYYEKEEKKRQFYTDTAGSLLLEDYRPTETIVSTERSAPSKEIERGKQRGGPALRRVGPGQTAFEWRKSARYYQDKRKAVLTGDVHMVSMGYALTLPGRSSSPTDSKTKSLNRTEMWCQTFTIIFAEPESTEPEMAKSDFADLSTMDELRVELVETSGNASMVSKDISVEGAERILYDRDAGEIVIEGSRRSRATVVYLDPQRRQWIQWTGNHARYDVATGELKAKGGTSRVLQSN